ncbi:FUSC family protein [Methylobacterium sp. NPDC080182]|uniref:FUSC family protein n=1 Tax=Methylobacterium sp. NPDC080182 TaxID=3390590 RepID=UPI003CFEFD0A
MTYTLDRRDGWVAVLDRLVPPAGAWIYGLRIWCAMMLALYAAFLLQLESASSAAVCVAILAQPRRGQALSKAFYRIGGTLLGFAVSVVLTALFGQDRVLMLVAFTTWLGLCVFLASHLEGPRAYGAVLSGYTVAIIAIAHIDQPFDVFEAGLARVAAITLGIVSVTFINDALGAPRVFTSLWNGLAQARAQAGALVRHALRDDAPAPDAVAAVLRAISGTHADMIGVAGEFDDGPERAAGARSAAAAIITQMGAARVFARAAARNLSAGHELGRHILKGLDGDPGAAAAVEGDLRLATAGSASPETVLLLRRAADVLRQETWIADGFAAVATGRRPQRAIDLPVHRDFPDAFREALRAVLAVAISSALFILSGWPGTTTGLLQIAAFAGIMAINPQPVDFARGALIGVPAAIVSAGIVKFVVLNGGQGFPLLAIAMAPVVFVACFLSRGKRTGSFGFVLLVFFPLFLAPANPQTYDLQAFLDQAVLFAVSSLVSLLSTMFLNASDAKRRAWSLETLRGSLIESLAAEPAHAAQRESLNGDRLARFSKLRTDSEIGHRSWMRHAFALASLDTSAAGAQTGLNLLVDDPAFDAPIEAARAALEALDADALKSAAVKLLAAAREPAADTETLDVVAAIVADLMTVAHSAEDDARILRRLALHLSP